MSSLPLFVHDERHDALLTGLSGGHFPDESAFVHHVDPVAHAQQLGHLGRDHHHAFSGGRQIVDQTIDFIFGPDINARVGSSRIKTSGPANSHFERTTFCWLPPDRFTTFWNTPGVRMPRSLRYFSATSVSA